jgi:HTH-type transcriptional regulator/antitoxin HigA
MESQRQDLRQEIAEYEALKTQAVPQLELQSLSELPELLIQVRLARGYTQAEFARKLKITPQQLQRYEATRYQSISFKRLLEITQALDLDLHETVKL